jgi:excinuclease UvrABC nuclease subunit
MNYWQLVDPFALPSMPFEQRKALPRVPAVYFLIGGDSEVLYIGESYNLRSRWGHHHCLTDYEPEQELRIAWIEIEDDMMRGRIETALIWSHRPRLNHTSGHGPYGRGPAQPLLPAAVGRPRKETNGK